MLNTRYAINTASLDVLKRFYKNNAALFFPKMFETTDLLMEYVEKLKNNAEIFEAYDDDALIGVVAVYLNNMQTKVGFITSVIVDKKYHRNGVANQLIKALISSEKLKLFRAIDLYVYKDNMIAINLYKKHGFTINNDQHSCKIKDFVTMSLAL